MDIEKWSELKAMKEKKNRPRPDEEKNKRKTANPDDSRPFVGPPGLEPGTSGL